MPEDRIRRVRYLKSVGNMLFDGEDRETPYPVIDYWRLAGGFLTPLKLAENISLSSLRKALIDAAIDNPGHYTPGSRFPLDARASFLLADAAPDEFDNKWSPVLDTCIELTPNEQLVVKMEFGVRDESFSQARLAELLSPVLRDTRATLIDAVDDGSEGPWAGHPWPWAMWVAPTTRGRTVRSALALSERIRRVIDCTEGGRVDLDAALDLFRAGDAPAIYGLPESDWLEAKARGYHLATDHGKIELGQDVSRFANSETGGLLVLGLGTRKRDATETIVSGPGIRFGSTEARRYRQIIDNRVFPPIDGLRVESVSDGHGRSRDLLLIHIPPQPAELKPFLVHGAIVHGKVEGAFISIVRRRGEQSIPIRPESIHGALSAGLALLRPGSETGGSGSD